MLPGCPPASRPTRADPFGSPTALTELNSPQSDQDLTILPDMRYVVFSSARSGSSELYEAFR